MWSYGCGCDVQRWVFECLAPGVPAPILLGVRRSAAHGKAVAVPPHGFDRAGAVARLPALQGKLGRIRPNPDQYSQGSPLLQTSRFPLSRESEESCRTGKSFIAGMQKLAGKLRAAQGSAMGRFGRVALRPLD